METCSQIKSTSKYTIPESKSPSSIFLILTIDKKQSLSDGHSQMKPTFIFFLSFKPVFPCVCCEIRSLQKQSVHFRQTFPIHRHNSYRRPPQPNPDSRLQACMQESPKKSYKKHSFTPNKQIHSKLKSVIHFSGVVPSPSFAGYITPPQKNYDVQTQEANQNQASSSPILMKIQYRALQHKHNAQSSLPWPRTRIYLVITMVRPPMRSRCTKSFVFSVQGFFPKKKSHQKKKRKISKFSWKITNHRT